MKKTDEKSEGKPARHEEEDAAAAIDGGSGTPPTATVAASSAPDPFDPQRLRLSQDFGSNLGIKKVVLKVPVQKPNKEVFFRCHPDEAYSLNTGVLELKATEKEMFLVAPELWGALAAEPTFAPRKLITTVTRQGDVSLFPIRLPGFDGKLDPWNQSAMDAAEIARHSWTRITANMTIGANEVVVAEGITATPIWPSMSMREMLSIAFKGRYIDRWDHPVLRKLRGEI